MISMMKKALHLEGVEDNSIDSDGTTESRRRGRCLRKDFSDSLNSFDKDRPSSPISRFRYINGEDDEDNSVGIIPNQHEYIPNLTNTAVSESSVVASTTFDFVIDKRDEEDEEHQHLSFFFRPVEKTGDLSEKIKREIEAARKAASICVTVDHIKYINEHTSSLTEVEQYNIEKLREEIRNPSTKLNLRSTMKRKLLDSRLNSNFRDLDVNSKISSLFRLRQFVVEQDEIGEGVSVQTSLSTYEEERRRYFAKKYSSPRRSSVGNEEDAGLNRALSDSDDEYNSIVEFLNTGNNDMFLIPDLSKEKRDDDSRSNNKQSRNVAIAQRNVEIASDEKSLDIEVPNCLSATESDVGSVDGLPSNLQSKWLMGESPKEQMLASLDGIQSLAKLTPSFTTYRTSSPSSSRNPFSTEIINEDEKVSESQNIYDVWPFNMILCGKDTCNTQDDEGIHRRTWKEHTNVPLALMDCANIIYQEDRIPVTAPAIPTSLVRVASEPTPLSYAETLLAAQVDPRMQDWISSRFKMPGKPPKDGTYQLGKSRTVIVHEIARGAWTWCTEWSPDGSLLAVATENHHLAVIDTTASTVWRVRHDRRIKGPMKNHTTHSIRAIAWGHKFIAIGGTGDAVSILAPTQPYPILHTITGTGFVGALDWREKSNVLAFGSRLDKVTIVRISSTDEDSVIHGWKQTESRILHKIDLKHWANSVKFSPGGNYLAVGDAGGVISVYNFAKLPKGKFEPTMIAWFPRKDSILSVEWSPDAKWLYAGGEDRCVTVIDCSFWEIVHKKGRERWVQCIASSHSGSHLAVGGVSSEISLLDTNNGWDSVMGVELKGLVPLSASWHPKDQYLSLTGQSNSILVVETTNARHVKGHHLCSMSPILAIEFSPDGRMVIIGNQAGVVTFFSLSGTTFITAYELIVTLNRNISARWSLNGTFAVIGGKDAVVIVGHKKAKRVGKKAPPHVSGFSVRRVIRDFGETNAVSIDFRSHYIAVSGNCTRILDARSDFAVVREWNNGPYYANSWSPDGRWFAMIGEAKLLTIYDTSEERTDRWRPIFSMKCDFVGLSLAWGPLIVGGLLYLAYGGTSNEIFIMEIRTREGTWETVLRIPRDGAINALDWSTDGLLAAAIGNGTVGIIDLGYLQSGVAVNEMDYNWQRQALTCFTEIRRNRGRNSMRSIRWLPAAPGSDRLLAVGGTDGEVEILDLTERRRCRGYLRGS